MQMFPAFAVPMAAGALPDSDKLNLALKTLLLKRDGDDFKNPYASMEQPPGLFESDFNFFSWPDAPVQALRQSLWQAVSAYIAELNNYDQASLSQLHIRSHTWYHITRRGGFFGMHNHPMASVSGVYCVDPGTHDLNQPTSGILRFHSPFNVSNMYVDPGNAKPQAPFTSGNRSFLLKAGELVLFPSWLMHEVLPFYGDDARVTVAFNCWFERKDAGAKKA